MSALLSWLWKVPLCALAWLVGAVAGAALVGALGLPLPTAPPDTDPGRIAAFSALASLTLGIGLGPLARGLGAVFRLRFFALALLAWVFLGLSTALEARLFTTMGGTSGMAVLFLPASLACAAVVVTLFRPSRAEEAAAERWTRFTRQWPASQWVWRLALAVVVFPLVYFAFGMVVGPFVADAYRAGAFGLRLPGLSEVLLVQLLRGLLFLGASIPVLVLWRGSRLRLAASLGLAQFILVGLFGLVQGYWLPASLRLIHGAELLADSMVWAGGLALLLARPSQTSRPVVI